MQTRTIEFAYNARTTYTAVKNLFRKRTKFSNVKCNDESFVVEARRGSLLSPFTENVRMKVIATSFDTCRVVVESSSRSILNLLDWGVNKGNVSDLSGYISNEIYKLMPSVVAVQTKERQDKSTIQITTPEIKMR